MINALKQSLLAAYYYGTTPYRRLAAARAAHQGRFPVVVLFYHRVSDTGEDSCTISNQAFIEQIDWLRERFDMISLEEAQRRIRGGACERPGVAITFDDGYAENCEQALPYLIEHRVPCTYFACTGNVVEGLPFPHDVAAGTPRPVNTIAQLRALSAAGVEIGAHTRSHADLGRLHDPHRLRDEIADAGKEMAELIGWPVRYFAFPFGQHCNLNAQAFRIAREAGYEAVCSAYGGYNFPGDDDFHLQRFHGDPNLLRVKNWVTVDPRKRFGVKRYQCDLPAARRNAP